MPSRVAVRMMSDCLVGAPRTCRESIPHVSRSRPGEDVTAPRQRHTCGQVRSSESSSCPRQRVNCPNHAVASLACSRRCSESTVWNYTRHSLRHVHRFLPPQAGRLPPVRSHQKQTVWWVTLSIEFKTGRTFSSECVLPNM